MPKVFKYTDSGGMSMGGVALVKCKLHKDQPDFSYENTSGYRASGNGSGHVFLIQIVDRIKDFYKKYVVGLKTGRVIKDVEERLSEHKNQKSSRNKAKEH